MKRSQRRLLFKMAATIVAGGLGGAIGALGGIWVGIIGGITGAALPSVFDALPIQINRIPIVGHALRKRALVTEVNRKLELEFGASVPSDSKAALALLEEEARLIAGTPEFDVPGKLRMVQPPPVARPAASTGESYIELLRQVSPIRVVCPAICPSAVSVFKALYLNLSADIKLQIDFSPKNSGEMTERYRSERWDFCAISRLGLLATNSSIDQMLLQIAPLFNVSQYMLCRPTWRRSAQTQCVLMVRESPSEAQFWAQYDKHRTAKKDYVRQDEIIGTAENLKDDEYLIIWEPLASWIATEYDLEVRRDTEFKFLITLMVNSEWAKQNGAHRVHAFYRIFRQQWDAGAQDLKNMLRLLARDSDYLNAFASAVGMLPI
jgi:hypothetical protein